MTRRQRASARPAGTSRSRRATSGKATPARPPPARGGAPPFPAAADECPGNGVHRARGGAARVVRRRDGLANRGGGHPVAGQSAGEDRGGDRADDGDAEDAAHVPRRVVDGGAYSGERGGKLLHGERG